MRVYFVDLITVYKTICQFPVVSMVNSRTPVIFQMWLHPPGGEQNQWEELEWPSTGGASELLSILCLDALTNSLAVAWKRWHKFFCSVTGRNAEMGHRTDFMEESLWNRAEVRMPWHLSRIPDAYSGPHQTGGWAWGCWVPARHYCLMKCPVIEKVTASTSTLNFLQLECLHTCPPLVRSIHHPPCVPYCTAVGALCWLEHTSNADFAGDYMESPGLFPFLFGLWFGGVDMKGKDILKKVKKRC